jgi:hypothetical protein
MLIKEFSTHKTNFFPGSFQIQEVRAQLLGTVNQQLTHNYRKMYFEVTEFLGDCCFQHHVRRYLIPLLPALRMLIFLFTEPMQLLVPSISPKLSHLKFSRFYASLFLFSGSSKLHGESTNPISIDVALLQANLTLQEDCYRRPSVIWIVRYRRRYHPSRLDPLCKSLSTQH